MANGKDIRFKHSWWQVLRAVTRDIRDEVMCAIFSYGMEQTEPDELSDMAKGLFAQIRTDIDEHAAHEEEVREKRRNAGHLGAVKTNASRWGEDRQKSANVGKSRQMSANADENTQNGTFLSANADNSSANVGKSRQMSANADENTQNGTFLSANADNSSANVGKSRQMPIVSPDPSTMQNNIYNYIISRHDDGTRTHTYAMVVGWLTDDPEAIKLLFWRAGVTKDRSEEEQLQLMAEYVDAYYEQNEFATDWQQKGRRDTKSHFSSWVRVRYKKLTEDGTASKPTATGGRSRTTAGEAYDAIAVGIAIANAEDGTAE